MPKKVEQTVTVGGKSIPLAADRTIVEFTSGENGPQEAGRYCFWCLYGEDEFGPWTCSGRALDSLPPEDRFERFAKERLREFGGSNLHNSAADRAAYEAMWRRLPSAKGMRAATYREVAHWMATHMEDAIYARPHWTCQGREVFGVPPKEIV